MKDEFLTSAQASEALRKRGMRVTPQRLAVLEAVQESHSHLSAEEVYEEVRRRIPSISLGTVYKALGELRDVGQVRALQIAGKFRFDGGVGPHSHLVCQRCHRVEDVGVDAEVTLPPEAQRGYELLGVEVSFWGICPGCREQSGSPRATNRTTNKRLANGKGS
ncbi:MAG: Fur family transcriptional regulator [Actinomycetota bacterium]